MTKPTDPPKTLLPKKQVAEMLGISAKTIDRRIRNGNFPSSATAASSACTPTTWNVTLPPAALRDCPLSIQA